MPFKHVPIERVGLDNNGNVGTPAGHFNAAWYEGNPGVCQTEGNGILTAHSAMGNQDGKRALVPTDFPQVAKENAVGSVIETTTSDGTLCTYRVKWVKSVDKFGKGPGTFGYLVTHNPTGRHLYDQHGAPGLVFISGDETQGWNSAKGTSNASAVVYAERIFPEKKSSPKIFAIGMQRALGRASIQ
jgi:hypothetical protein